MAHTHDVYDMENHFEINGSSRFIKETSETKLVVVQGDHKSEVLTFKMPRYIDGHDMTLCNKIRIHYINLDTKTNNKSADVYEVTDLTLCEECEDVLTFTWTIEAPATKYSGTLSFLVKFECTEGENVLYQWNTAKYVSVNVLAGIDNSEEFVEKYSNVLEEWYNELTKGADSIEELNQQAIAEIELAKEDAKEDIQGKADATMAEMNQFSSNAYNSFKNDVNEKAQQTLESIPEDYSDLDAEVKNIRVGIDGTVYDSAGEAVRSQIRNAQCIEDVTINLFDGTTEDGGLYLAGSGAWYETSQYYSIGSFSLKKGEKLYVSAKNIPQTGMQFTKWVDEECNNFNTGMVLTPDDGCIVFDYATDEIQYVKIGVPVSIPKDTINVRYTAEIESYYKLKKNINKSDVNGLVEDIKTIENDIGKINNDIKNIGVDNQWQGKKWVAFGTSITATNNTHAPDGTCSGKYVPYLEELSGLSLTNRGVSGGRISGHILYYVHYYASEMANADLITIEGSVNDFAGDVPLGQIGDTIPYTNADVQEQVDEYIASIGGSNEGTFAGACYQVFKKAQENAPNAVIVFITDNTGKKVIGGGNLERSLVHTATGLKQSDYINMAVAVAEYMGIPVIDAGRKSLVNEEHPDYLIDHIHHTELGGEQYASMIWAELKNIPNLITE